MSNTITAIIDGVCQALSSNLGIDTIYTGEAPPNKAIPCAFVLPDEISLQEDNTGHYIERIALNVRYHPINSTACDLSDMIHNLMQCLLSVKVSDIDNPQNPDWILKCEKFSGHPLSSGIVEIKCAYHWMTSASNDRPENSEPMQSMRYTPTM